MVYTDTVCWFGLQARWYDLSIRPKRDARKTASHDHVGPTLHILFQEVMELQKDAMHGEEVGLSPCASGSARFCHMFVPTILEMGGLQILCIPGADRQWKYRGAVPARGKPCQRWQSAWGEPSVWASFLHPSLKSKAFHVFFIFIKSKNLMNFDQGTDAWLCARQRDNNFISTYAADNPTRLYEPYLGSKYESIIDTYIKQL